jgi:hypothetical protein
MSLTTKNTKEHKGKKTIVDIEEKHHGSRRMSADHEWLDAIV